MDTQRPEVARQFTEAARVQFPTAIDRAQGLWEVYGFNVIPNGFFVDEHGIVRYVKIGGFEVRNPEDAQDIERLLAEPVGQVVALKQAPPFGTVQEALRQAEEDWKREPGNPDRLLNLAERRIEAKQYSQALEEFKVALEKNPRSARALMGRAAVYLDQGEREKALAALKQAWALEPDNWIIRKQIWAVEHPEQFYPAINTGWQKEQIAKEKATQK